MKVSDYLAAKLSHHGLSSVYLVTGGGAMHLNDAFARHPQLEVHCFHHEQAAAIAAEGYARAIQKPCILNVTTGPGALNALVGVYGAYVDSVPMFVASGQVKVETLAATYPQVPLRQLGDQEVDITSMIRPIVKYVRAVNTSADVFDAIDRAIFLMTFGRPGPVWLDIPIDIQAARLPDSQIAARKEYSLDFDAVIDDLLRDEGCTPNTILELQQAKARFDEPQDQFRQAIEKLSEAKRPLIFVGTGVMSSARAEFSRLINRVDLPVVPGWNAMDLIPSDHKNFAGRPGTVGDRAGNFAVQNADFILILGCRLNIRQISYGWRNFAKNAFKVMVDIDQAELDKPTLTIDLKIKTDVKHFLDYALKTIPDKSPELHREYRDWCRTKVQRYPVVKDTVHSNGPLNPYIFLYALSRGLSSDATVVAGNGAACVMTFQAFETKNGQRIFTNSGCASMGYELPAAIGAALALKRERAVICIAGDGSIMMNLQELQTLVGKQLPVKIFLLNNDGYLSIKMTQQAYFSDNKFGTDASNGLSLPSFRNVAIGFGLAYQSINNIIELEDFLKSDEFNSLKPMLIEVFVDPAQAFEPKLASRINADGTMSSPELDDMAPFLSETELSQNRLS
ncbi:acetolactate synthase-1/2/3 large subunit [Jezberella montanilacus]|uniref:Acetolactate synthase-1/2/3 large subunit n=1 Tax=Jezberella montanilacus TaxID=323426 RepID=A0A2T0XIF5_9BURK|nr:thiamine pyrophosphate-binding protein [Jezberella montanilacus]PRY98660.1 acetolactate synthase-1/2/3 large subunit [Jezberella montanilacus]